MSRGLSGAVAAALDAPHVSWFVLVEMVLDSGTLRLAGTPFPVDWNGYTWLATWGLGAVEATTETDTEIRGLRFTLSGVPASAIATVLTEPVQGRAVTLRLAVLDANNVVQVDVNAWQGTLDTLTLDDGRPLATVSVTAEHRLARWAVPKLVRFSVEDQRRINPADKFFEHAAAMSEASLVWPGKEWFVR